MSGYNPYREVPSASFWSSFASGGFSTLDLTHTMPESLRPGAKVISAGSCFAANLVPYLEGHGLEYVREEYSRPLYARIAPENLSYAKFSAGYGNIYTARQLLQLLRRCTGQWTPVEDRWTEKDKVIDPFRPGLRYYARNQREFELLTAQHLRAVRRAFEAADVFVFTLGLTEAWISTLDGAVFPACPGTVAGTFAPARHQFANFTVSEVRADLSAAIAQLRCINPRVDVILTVSPVPLVATAGGGHVLVATTYSKSVLRVAADEVMRSSERVSYFPAYEIVTGPQAPQDFFLEDRRSVSKAAVDTVMAAFFAHIGTAAPMPRTAAPQTEAAIRALSKRIVEFECEEAFADTGTQTKPTSAKETAPAQDNVTEDATTRVQHAVRCVEQDRTEEARILALKALELDPHHRAALRLAAELHKHAGRLEAASDFYAQLLRLDPKDNDSRLCRAECAALLGHHVLAELLIEEVIDADPDNAKAKALLAALPCP